MKLQLLAAAASVALLALPTLASANDAGWYVRGNAGYGIITDTDFTGDLVGDVEGEGNLATSLGLGYAFGNNWRLEVDASQLWNDTGAIGQAGNTSSDMRITSGMLNAIYDFSDFGAWEPYIGAGIGIARTRISNQAASNPSGLSNRFGGAPINSVACPGSNVCTFDNADTGVAWNLIAGLGYKITDNLTWDTQYRYLNVGDLDFTGLARNLTPPIAAGNLGSGAKIESTASGAGSHSVMTGLRYRFGAAAPKKVVQAPTPIPEPVDYVTCWDNSQALTLGDCPAEVVRTFTCWDQSVVTDANNCPARPAPTPPTIQCSDGTMVYDAANCPVQRYSVCDAGATNFVVYFPWDKSSLTEQAKAVILNATNRRTVQPRDTELLNLKALF